jgi:hypothetical protein
MSLSPGLSSMPFLSLWSEFGKALYGSIGLMTPLCHERILSKSRKMARTMVGEEAISMEVRIDGIVIVWNFGGAADARDCARCRP